jgi:hypothetical protein
MTGESNQALRVENGDMDQLLACGRSILQQDHFVADRHPPPCGNLRGDKSLGHAKGVELATVQRSSLPYGQPLQVGMVLETRVHGGTVARSSTLAPASTSDLWIGRPASRSCQKLNEL